jgi:hypothetical protein
VYTPVAYPTVQGHRVKILPLKFFLSNLDMVSYPIEPEKYAFPNSRVM